MTTEQSHPLHDLPAPTFARLIDFERADVITPMIYPPRPTLVVSGVKPVSTMTVALRPLTYIRQPEYWGIEVVGTLPPGLTPTPLMTNVPYAVELLLDSAIGTVGIEVIGATKTEQIPLVTETTTEYVGAVRDALFHPMYPDQVGGPGLRLTTAGVKDSGGPEAGAIDLTPYEGSVLRVLGHLEGEWIYSASIAEQVPHSILAIVARQVLSVRPR
jgi:hypothetical protein